MSAPASRPEIRLEPGTLVIADLHLDAGPQGGEHEEFVRFARAVAGKHPRLIVLGDLFDAWIGPAQMELAAAQRALNGLIALTASGTKLDVLAGNRDFLLERRFAALTHAEVRPHGLVGLMGRERVLFIHGDELCTRDLGYQRLKRVLRSAPFLWGAPRVPRPVSLAIAKRLRKASVSAVAAKPAAEKEQQSAEVARMSSESSCSTVVCGHAHLFRDERAGETRWIVLDAFGGERDVLELGPGARLSFRASRSFGSR